jgi:hypothetical protein
LGPKIGVELGGLSLPSGSGSGVSDADQKQIETPFLPKRPVRGKAREYSQAFEIAWKAYGRKEQKFEAFGVWLLRAKELGGEPQLLTLILKALKWQGPLWAVEGWKFAPYFERYLKRRKWDDEEPPAPTKVAQKLETWEERRQREQREETDRRARELADIERRTRIALGGGR